MTHSTVEVAPSSLEQLTRLGDAYKLAGAQLRTEIRAALRAPAKPLIAEVIRQGSEKMPATNGLRAHIAQAKGGVTISLLGKTVKVSLAAKSDQGYALAKIDDGIVKHPVFGNRKVWVSQDVPAHAFTDVFYEKSPEVVGELEITMQHLLDKIAMEA